MMDFVKSTTGSAQHLLGFALAVIVGSMRKSVIDCGVLTVGSRPPATYATAGSVLSVSMKKWRMVDLGSSYKSASMSAPTIAGTSSACSSSSSVVAKLAWPACSGSCRLAVCRLAAALEPLRLACSNVPFGPKWESTAFSLRGKMPVLLKPFLIFWGVKALFNPRDTQCSNVCFVTTWLRFLEVQKSLYSLKNVLKGLNILTSKGCIAWKVYEGRVSRSSPAA
jgi:hypothetical protein